MLWGKETFARKELDMEKNFFIFWKRRSDMFLLI